MAKDFFETVVEQQKEQKRRHRGNGGNCMGMGRKCGACSVDWRKYRGKKFSQSELPPSVTVVSDLDENEVKARKVFGRNIALSEVTGLPVIKKSGGGVK